MGVFTITATSSLFAYIWLYICLLDSEIDEREAWLTFTFFFILIALSYAADKCKSIMDAKNAEKGSMTIKYEA